MKVIVLFCCSVLVLLSTAVLQADVYSWIDENGVRRFSNVKPDPTAENMEIHQEIQSDPDRGQYESPVDRESVAPPPGWNEVFDAQERARKARERRDEREQQQASETAFRRKVQAERARLQEEIDRIRQLAVGPSLPLSLKNARIKPYQDKLDELEKSPEDYFRNKAD